MTSVVDTSVKFFHSAMEGMPQLSGTAGARIAILDAVLVNGMGLKSVDSLVVASNVATVNISSGHMFEVGSVILIAGATPDALNGEQRVTSVTNTAATFATTGIANSVASGSITAKLAPAGFSKAFTGTNLAAYKSNDVTSSGSYLRVDDTTATTRVCAYETMSDINTGTGQFPTTTQQSGGLFWSKSNAASSAPRAWLIYADSSTFYMFVYTNDNTFTNVAESHAFGDLVSTKNADTYRGFISGSSTDTGGYIYAPDTLFYGNPTTPANLYVSRSYTSVGGAQKLLRTFPIVTGSATGAYSGNVAGGMPYPNAPDGGIYLANYNIAESANLNYRGILPGILGCPQLIPAGTLTTKDIISGTVNGVTKKVSTVVSANTVPGVLFFDVTGPWR